jgi:hypothetical protein
MRQTTLREVVSRSPGRTLLFWNGIECGKAMLNLRYYMEHDWKVSTADDLVVVFHPRAGLGAYAAVLRGNIRVYLLAGEAPDWLAQAFNLTPMQIVINNQTFQLDQWFLHDRDALRSHAPDLLRAIEDRSRSNPDTGNYVFPRNASNEGKRAE